MWPFTKPQLNDRVSIDVIIPGGDLPVEFRNVDRLFLEKFLTRRQIKYLNRLVPPKMEVITEEDVKKVNEQMMKERFREIAEKKRKDEFTDLDHIQSDEDYAAYMLNNKDQMMMSDSEFGKFKDMLFGINKHRQEVEEKIEQAEKSGKAMPGASRQTKEYNEFFLKSASGQDKK